MTEGNQRRSELIALLKKSNSPISGAELAKTFQVSRQVIVQDIALLRATDKNILSTNKGYILFDPLEKTGRVKRTIAVHHGDDQMQEELYLIVDNGGCVLDVVVEHEIYGQITADLILKNRRDVDEFIDKMQRIGDRPLKELTGGNHFHTIEAESAQILDRIEVQLKEKGIIS
jgi:hypothetical protein